MRQNLLPTLEIITQNFQKIQNFRIKIPKSLKFENFQNFELKFPKSEANFDAERGILGKILKKMNFFPKF